MESPGGDLIAGESTVVGWTSHRDQLCSCISIDNEDTMISWIEASSGTQLLNDPLEVVLKVAGPHEAFAVRPPGGPVGVRR